MENGEEKSASPEPDPAPLPRQRRPFCERCSKPASVCLCSRIKLPPIENSIGVTILQHSLEGKHHLNSARVASLGLRNVAVVPVADVLFQAEYTIHPLRRGSSHDPLAGVDRQSEGRLDLVSNASALPGGDSMMAIDLHSIDANEDDDDERFRDGSRDPAVAWSDGDGSLPDPITGEEERCRAVAANRRTCSEDKLCYSENGEAAVQNSKTGDETITRVSISPMLQEKDSSISTCASFGMSSDHQLQPKNQCVSPDEEGITTVNSALYKIICSSSNVWISLKRTARPDLSWALSKPVLKSAASNGFTVQKLQRRESKGCKKLDVVDEFHLLIPPGTAVLFPGKAAVDLDSVDFDVKHLILLDGTWDKARRMFHENPWLQLLPRLKLEMKAESLYKEVRHQPRPGCLSTIESIVCALKVLDNNRMEGLDELLEVFESMVADQRRLKEEKFSRMSLS
ncbi:unnamed protein product [Spirodela intermedia]|uniref:tRNA-uridine aminocarboxypropyltransferase n=1 Tax=Spirodela intermedia TaxID=51605 RepID=A0A7I8JEX9_SPIIN|nr:unnamed protein product [Spirodela intermedia]CAA6668714.1 unnamed protein product [Spirodela intermedia]